MVIVTEEMGNNVQRSIHGIFSGNLTELLGITIYLQHTYKGNVRVPPLETCQNEQ
jgi:cytoskeletal protein CcmA (bactofilin family)